MNNQNLPRINLFFHSVIDVPIFKNNKGLENAAIAFAVFSEKKIEQGSKQMFLII